MKLTKAQRHTLFAMFDGRCAYCGEPLGDRWHADHVLPVERKLTFHRGRGLVATGELHRPENDRFENLMPACPPCNIDKHSSPLEAWREKLARSLEVLARNQPTYRHARRFGLLCETPQPVVFYFERIAAREGLS